MIDALRVRGALYLLLAVTIGRLPQAMSALAIVRLVRDQGGDFGLAALLTSVYSLASTAGQPLLARAVDRTGRARPVALISAVVAALALVGLAAWAVSAPLAVALALALVAGLATPPLESCLRALWVRIMTPGKQLHSAFSMDAAAQEVLFISGPLLAAVGILVFGAQGNVLLMAGIGLVGAVLFAAHPLLRRITPEIVEGRAGTPLTLGRFRLLLVVQFCLAIPVGALTITATGFGELLRSEEVGALALAINATGALAGAIWVARRPLRRAPAALLRPLGVLFGLLYLPTALTGLGVAYWLAAAAVSGFLLPVMLTQVFHQTERSVPARQLNEANAWTVSAFGAGIAAGTLLGGMLVDLLGHATGIAATVVAASAVTVLGSLLARPRVLAVPAAPEVPAA